MGIFDELASSTGNPASNAEMVSRCLGTPALLHTMAEGLRTGAPEAKTDCAEIMITVGRTKPDLLRGFVNDFLDASRSKQRAVAKLGFQGLVLLSRTEPSEVFAQRDYLFEVAKAGDTLGQAAAAVLAALCANNTNYRGKLVASVVRLLVGLPDRELPKWLKILAPAFEGSLDSWKRLTRELAPRREQLPEPLKTQLEKVLSRIERSLSKAHH